MDTLFTAAPPHLETYSEVLRSLAQCCAECYAKEQWGEFVATYRYNPADFILDQSSGIVFYRLDRQERHEAWMAKLYNTLHAEHPLSEADASSQYVLKHYGIFRSRATPHVYHGAHYTLPEALRVLKRDLLPL